MLTDSYVDPDPEGVFFSAQTDQAEGAAEVGTALPRTVAVADVIPGATVTLISH